MKQDDDWGETGLEGAVGATHRADSERNGGIRAGCPTTDENRGDWRGRTANEKKQRERKRKKAAGDGAFCSRGLGIAAESAAHRHTLTCTLYLSVLCTLYFILLF